MDSCINLQSLHSTSNSCQCLTAQQLRDSGNGLTSELLNYLTFKTTDLNTKSQIKTFTHLFLALSIAFYYFCKQLEFWQQYPQRGIGASDRKYSKTTSFLPQGGGQEGALSTRQLYKTMAKREYIQTNKKWLEDKAKEEGVKALPKGIYYKVISEGNNDGKHPTPRSIITAHYSGWTINGKKFDSSRGGAPLAVRLCDLIEGWIIAMQQMCVGDKWEIYIPSEMGYGKFSQPGIPGGSTLIFEIELIGIA